MPLPGVGCTRMRVGEATHPSTSGGLVGARGAKKGVRHVKARRRMPSQMRTTDPANQGWNIHMDFVEETITVHQSPLDDLDVAGISSGDESGGESESHGHNHDSPVQKRINLGEPWKYDKFIQSVHTANVSHETVQKKHVRRLSDASLSMWPQSPSTPAQCKPTKIERGSTLSKVLHRVKLAESPLRTRPRRAENIQMMASDTPDHHQSTGTPCGASTKNQASITKPVMCTPANQGPHQSEEVQLELRENSNKRICTRQVVSETGPVLDLECSESERKENVCPVTRSQRIVRKCLNMGDNPEKSMKRGFPIIECESPKKQQDSHIMECSSPKILQDHYIMEFESPKRLLGSPVIEHESPIRLDFPIEEYETPKKLPKKDFPITECESPKTLEDILVMEQESPIKLLDFPITECDSPKVRDWPVMDCNSPEKTSQQVEDTFVSSCTGTSSVAQISSYGQSTSSGEVLSVKADGRPSDILQIIREVMTTPEKDTSAWELKADLEASTRKKFIRRGLAERVKMLLSKQDSKVRLWKHDIGKDPVKARRGSVTLRMDGAHREFSTMFLNCTVLLRGKSCSSITDNVTITLNPEEYREWGIKIGCHIILEPPWQRLKIPRSARDVILSPRYVIVDHREKQEEQSLMPLEHCTENFVTVKLEEDWCTTIPASISDHCVKNQVSFTALVQRVFLWNREDEDGTKFPVCSLLVQDLQGSLGMVSVDRDYWMNTVCGMESGTYVFTGLRLRKKLPYDRCRDVINILDSAGVKLREPEGIICTFLADEDATILEVPSQADTCKFIIPVTLTLQRILSDEGLKRFSFIGKLLHKVRDRLFVSDPSLNTYTTIIAEDGDKLTSGELVLITDATTKNGKVHGFQLQSRELARRQKIGGKFMVSSLGIGDLAVGMKGAIVMDMYSRLFPSPLSGIMSKVSTVCDMVDIQIYQPQLPKLHPGISEFSLAKVKGMVTRVYEETSFFWPACPECSCDLEEGPDEGWFMCISCNNATDTPNMKYIMEVSLLVDEIAAHGSLVRVTLRDPSAAKILEGITSRPDGTYPCEEVIGRHTGPHTCCVHSVKPGRPATYYLEEI